MINLSINEVWGFTLVGGVVTQVKPGSLVKVGMIITDVNGTNVRKYKTETLQKFIQDRVNALRAKSNSESIDVTFEVPPTRRRLLVRILEAITYPEFGLVFILLLPLFLLAAFLIRRWVKNSKPPVPTVIEMDPESLEPTEQRPSTA